MNYNIADNNGCIVLDNLQNKYTRDARVYCTFGIVYSILHSLVINFLLKTKFTANYRTQVYTKNKVLEVHVIPSNIGHQKKL